MCRSVERRKDDADLPVVIGQTAAQPVALGSDAFDAADRVRGLPPAALGADKLWVDLRRFATHRTQPPVSGPGRLVRRGAISFRRSYLSGER